MKFDLSEYLGFKLLPNIIPSGSKLAKEWWWAAAREYALTIAALAVVPACVLLLVSFKVQFVAISFWLAYSVAAFICLALTRRQVLDTRKIVVLSFGSKYLL